MTRSNLVKVERIQGRHLKTFRTINNAETKQIYNFERKRNQNVEK